jgi:hypothetical protein
LEKLFSLHRKDSKCQIATVTETVNITVKKIPAIVKIKSVTIAIAKNQNAFVVLLANFAVLKTASVIWSLSSKYLKSLVLKN